MHATGDKRRKKTGSERGIKHVISARRGETHTSKSRCHCQREGNAFLSKSIMAKPNRIFSIKTTTALAICFGFVIKY